MSGSGKGDRGKRRRSFKGRSKDYAQPVPVENWRTGSTAKKPDRSVEISKEKNSGSYERPQWMPPKMSTEPLPVPDCPYCGKPIRELALAISDKSTGQAVHFDCVLTRLSQSEKLEPGEIISYIGGGRFGIVQQGGQTGSRGITIRKTFEWEIKEKRAEWRGTISDHFSVT